ncbi:DeoR/GlpR family DNA-binding transcription regulator [Aquibacillus kalidii]|uniref:DeoR/GlpR family DNA-binding transcription regulator n=1 Tax=Aquibacillus kalidii TaxID=2762597 RepID=UPI001648A950|nr:DeoR/GlpR family DNA-binding transcription regulator [Aquibacillus kalidii]
MLTIERQSKILELLNKKDFVTIQELVDQLSSSESTIRRDLSQLEKEKKLRRVHGGASNLHQKGEEPSLTEKSTKYLKEKDVIASNAAGLVQNGDCIFLDAGTTTYQMIKHLSAKDITVVTNGLNLAQALLELEIDTHLIGGLIKRKTNALIGPKATETLSQFRFDKSFIGVNGIHLDFGYTTPDPQEAAVKALAVNLGQKVYVLADASKFQEVTFSKVSDLKNAIIITNQLDLETYNEFSSETEVKMVNI